MISVTFDLLAEAERDGFRATVKSVGKVGGQYNGPCILPGCGGIGNDRLRIQPNVGQYGRFACSICGTSGSGVDWLMLARGMSKNEALAYVGWMPKDGSTPHLHKNHTVSSQLSLAERSETWQINAFNLARLASVAMNEETRAYLHSRRVTDAMITEYALGLYDQYKRVDKKAWGESRSELMVIPRGIVIPWLDEDKNVRCIRIRRLPWDTSEDWRYKALYGVCSSQFYNGHRIVPGCKVAVFEGEFTSIVAQDACREQGIVCVATGSTSWCRNDANVRLLASADKVIVCFDNDENLAGDKASAWWLDRLENAKRWRPLWGDANDMAMDGIDVGAWLALGFEDENTSPLPVANKPDTAKRQYQDSTKTVPNTDDTLRVVTPNVTEGEQTDYSYEPTPEDLAWLDAQLSMSLCGQCLEENRETPAVGDYEGMMYCADHLPVKEVKSLDKEEIVERFKTDLPGWTVTIEPRKTPRQMHFERERSKWIHDPSRPRVPEEVWFAIPRARIQQRLVDEWLELGEDKWRELGKTGTGLYWMWEDYYTQDVPSLYATGYAEEFEASEQALLNRCDTPRSYPGPVPRYELQEDANGVKHLVIVGYWTEQSQEVSA